MSELRIPEHWAEAELKNLVDLIRNGFSCQQTKDGIGFPVSRIETVWNWGVDFNRVGYAHIPNDKIDKYRLLKGDILFSHIHGYEYIGKSGLYEDDRVLYHGMNSLLIRLTNEGIQPKFFYYYLKSEKIRNHWKAICKRAINQVSLNTPNVNSLVIPIPPRQEQARIVQKIESCFQKIDETEKVLNEVEVLLTKYRESLLAKAFKGELIPQDPKDEPASKLLEKIRAERAKNANGKKVQEFAPISDDEKPYDLPAGWEWVRLNEVCSLIADIDHKMPKAVEKGVIFLSAKDLKDNGLLDFSNPKYISREDFEKLSRKVRPQKGDIIYSRIGARLGKARVVNVDTEFIVSYSCCTIRPLEEMINVNFLNCYLDSGFVLDQALRDVKGIGVPDLGMDKIKNFVLPLPPIEVQKNLLIKIQIIEENIKSISDDVIKNIQLISKMKETILSKAFQGTLVPRIGNEGTGQDLLAKILENKNQAGEESEKKVPKKTTKKAVKTKAKK